MNFPCNLINKQGNFFFSETLSLPYKFDDMSNVNKTGGKANKIAKNWREFVEYYF